MRKIFIIGECQQKFIEKMMSPRYLKKKAELTVVQYALREIGYIKLCEI